MVYFLNVPSSVWMCVAFQWLFSQDLSGRCTIVSLNYFEFKWMIWIQIIAFSMQRQGSTLHDMLGGIQSIAVTLNKRQTANTNIYYLYAWRVNVSFHIIPFHPIEFSASKIHIPSVTRGRVLSVKDDAGDTATGRRGKEAVPPWLESLNFESFWALPEYCRGGTMLVLANR